MKIVPGFMDLWHYIMVLTKKTIHAPIKGNPSHPKTNTHLDFHNHGRLYCSPVVQMLIHVFHLGAIRAPHRSMLASSTPLRLLGVLGFVPVCFLQACVDAKFDALSCQILVGPTGSDLAVLHYNHVVSTGQVLHLVGHKHPSSVT